MPTQSLEDALAQMSVVPALGVTAILHELKRAKVLDNAAIARIGDFMLSSLPPLDEGHPDLIAYRESLYDRMEEVLRKSYG